VAERKVEIMTDRGEWMRRFGAYTGRVQELVAEDVSEHGKPHEDRQHSIQDVKQYAVELGGLAFELYAAVCSIEVQWGAAVAKAEDTRDKLSGHLDAITTSVTVPVTYTNEVEWADREPNEENLK
jgi:hypothetical protein